MTVTFIGVDLAWRSNRNHTGIAVTRGELDGARLVESSDGIKSLDAASEFIARYVTADTVVAIDAPLVIKNPTGQRPCETLIGKRFGRYDAAAHTSNLSLYPDANSVALVRMLEDQGFVHDPNPATAKQRAGRWLFEVYPHPAQVVLFHLDRIIKYKKGTLANKRSGLGQLRRHLESLREFEPPLHPSAALEELFGRDLGAMPGRQLKCYEDVLDAIFCSYLALYFWYWGEERAEIIGTLEAGYIVNPRAAGSTESRVSETLRLC